MNRPAAFPVDATPVRNYIANNKLATVTATVPKPYTLRLDDGVTCLAIAAGVQELPEDVVNHWFSQANGVEKYEPEVPAVDEEAARLAAEAKAAEEAEAQALADQIAAGSVPAPAVGGKKSAKLG